MGDTVILILGAAVWDGGQASPALRRRVLHGLALWREDPARRIICCGGLGRHAPSEADVMAQILRAHGVPRGRITLEARSTDTISNIGNALALDPDLAQARVIVVSDRYHCLRAGLIARGYGLDVTTSSPDPSAISRRSYARAWARDRFALLKTGWWLLGRLRKRC
ncbi:YdcF family protein [Thioclava sp. GXIMD2076]|uniref:YdcF family protein n=1 Tax=unclassified Thioclava TaxID=2621713 RepID=UPI0030CEC699